jgi:hypothetical protein
MGTSEQLARFETGTVEDHDKVGSQPIVNLTPPERA